MPQPGPTTRPALVHFAVKYGAITCRHAINRHGTSRSTPEGFEQASGVRARMRPGRNVMTHLSQKRTFRDME